MDGGLGLGWFVFGPDSDAVGIHLDGGLVGEGLVFLAEVPIVQPLARGVAELCLMPGGAQDFFPRHRRAAVGAWFGWLG